MSRAFIHRLINGIANGLIATITYNLAVSSGSGYPITLTVINLVLGMFIILNTADMIDAQHRRRD